MSNTTLLFKRLLLLAVCACSLFGAPRLKAQVIINAGGPPPVEVSSSTSIYGVTGNSGQIIVVTKTYAVYDWSGNLLYTYTTTTIMIIGRGMLAEN